MFSCLAPIDLTILENLAGRSPILTESLKGRGPLAQNSTINVNSDTMFRSTNGLGSLILGRREFTQSISGNTAVSEEMVRVFNSDNKKLLPYGSAINFDNRVLFTCSPQASSQGVFHSGMVALNLDSISSMRGKEPPVYDGMWTGVNALQLTQGNFGGIDRAFAFTFNVALSKIELYEILPTGSSSFDDGGIPITWLMESSSLFREDVKPKNVMLQLSGGEFAVDEVVGTVVFQVFFKPDQFGAYGQESCWIPWHTFSICASSGSKPLYYPRLGLPEPSADLCIPQLEIPARNGYTFQVRWIISGKCRLLRANFSAVTQMLPKFAAPICNATVSAPIAAAVIVPTPPPAAGVSWDDVVWSDVLFYQGSGGVASGSALGGQFIFNLNSPSALAEAYAYGLGTVSYTGGEVDCTLTITGGPWSSVSGKEFGIIINHSVAGDLSVVYDPPDITTNPQVFNFTVPASTGAVITISGGLPGSPVGAFAFTREGNGTTNGQFVVDNV